MADDRTTNPGLVAHRAYSLWLLPGEDDTQRLADLVVRLSRRFATRPFVPHVTIQGDIDRRLDDVATVAEGLARALPVRAWRVRGVEQSDHHFRALYLALDDADPTFAQLRARSAAAFGTEAGLSPFPHMSLAYGTLDAATKRDLAREFAAELPASLTLARLAVTLAGVGVAIASWRTLQCFALAPPAPDFELEPSS
ncbi:MAG: 2'-5' RNA ligase family protein [Casimicrobiaceae bacterium]